MPLSNEKIAMLIAILTKACTLKYSGFFFDILLFHVVKREVTFI